jgi:hypothetical protein
MPTQYLRYGVYIALMALGVVAYLRGKKISAVIACLLGLVGLVGVFVVNYDNETDKLIAQTDKLIAQIEAERVTMQKYSRIQERMTYEQVQSIIGHPGEELSRTNIAGYRTVMYSWTNSNGSNMNAMFQNGRLVSKAQFGLL